MLREIPLPCCVPELLQIAEAHVPHGLVSATAWERLHSISDPLPPVAAATPGVAATPTPPPTDPVETAVAAGMPVAPAVGDEAAPPMAPAELTLTEVASDDDLFNDPNLEIARLTSGEMREIVVPVEIGDDPRTTRRFRLSFKLRLDPVD